MWDMVGGFVGELSISYFIFIIAFLLLTIILYLIIGALFGSLVSKVEEANQVMLPAMIIIIDCVLCDDFGHDKPGYTAN